MIEIGGLFYVYAGLYTNRLFHCLSFIIYRFVVRVLHLRGRANRCRLAHRRRWGSRNLLSTLF